MEGARPHQCNHRAWSDFFIDVYVTEARAVMLSRLVVAAVFPFFTFHAWLLHYIKFIKRDKKARDLAAFNRELDRFLSTGQENLGLIVYPEGTRSTKPHSLPLRRGLLRYTFNHKCKAQVVMTRGKEYVLSQKLLNARRDVTVAVGYSDVIDPKHFEDFEAFFDAVQEEWDRTWTLVMGGEGELDRGAPIAPGTPGELRGQQLQRFTPVHPVFVSPMKQYILTGLNSGGSLVLLLMFAHRLAAGLLWGALGLEGWLPPAAVVLLGVVWFLQGLMRSG